MPMNWLVNDAGICLPLDEPPPHSFPEPYRLYRFLTDIEDVLRNTPDEQQQLQLIHPLVRQLLTSSDWIQMEFDPPAAQTGWSVRMLYDEPNFPLTVQMVAWAPGSLSPIHNHAALGVVALISGQEKNTFWRRIEAGKDDIEKDGIEIVGEQVLIPGDILCLTPGAIHQIEVMDDEPTITFNLYGPTNYQQRFEFDPVDGTAQNF
jgi:predicted metal-dependent enzyme (double-stranded beta helix superfamily)